MRPIREEITQVMGRGVQMYSFEGSFSEAGDDKISINDSLPPSPCSTSITNTPSSFTNKLTSLNDKGIHDKKTTRSLCYESVKSLDSIVYNQSLREKYTFNHERTDKGTSPSSIINDPSPISGTVQESFDSPTRSFYTCQNLDLDDSPLFSWRNPPSPRKLIFSDTSTYPSTASATINHSFTCKKISPASKIKGSYFANHEELSTSNVSNRAVYSDRFIPSRATSNLSFSIWKPAEVSKTSSTIGSNSQVDVSASTDQRPSNIDIETDPGNNNPSMLVPSSNPCLLNTILRCELLGENEDPYCDISMSHQRSSKSPNGDKNPHVSKDLSILREGNYLRFMQTSKPSFSDEYFDHAVDKTESIVKSFSLSPVRSPSSRRLFSIPQKQKRKIPRLPFKVLDAPALADDFYLNLVDWSSQNVLAVGLGSAVYLWSAVTSTVVKLAELGTNRDDAVTSVSWTQNGTHLAIGGNNGEVHLWDTVKGEKVRSMGGHSARVGSLAWSGSTLASGSRDRLIYLRDVRTAQPYTSRLAAHKQEICGLKFSFDDVALLASGGNDNKLLIWNVNNQKVPLHRFADHTAAVKAIAWSPHQHGVLASGGGTADRCIRFWNSLSGSALNCVDTGSQVCNLAWSRNCNEIVSTHGYSLNQIVVWKYPSMQKVATLTGHTYRVLYLSMSPDGSTIVT